MKKESLSVMFACAFGAFIGALSALEISARFEYGSYFWCVGALFGGLFAYCAVDFQRLCAGIARSYRVSASNVASAYHKATTWEPHPLYWKATATSVLGLLALATSFALMSHAIFSYLGPAPENEPVVHRLVSGVGAGFYLITTMLVVGAIFWPFTNKKKYWQKLDYDAKGSYQEFLSHDMSMGLLVFKYGNPIVIPFFLLWLFAHTLCGIGEYLWENKARIMNATITLAYFLCRETWRFIVRTFVYIHSERRTLCFVDAALGATTGFFFGSAVLGAVVGATLGFANYEFISIRWLKLVPAKAK